jgi:hypothetical protein
MTTIARVSAVVAVVLTVSVCMFLATDFRHKFLARGFNNRQCLESCGVGFSASRASIVR